MKKSVTVITLLLFPILATAQTGQLSDLVHERLSLMKDVAAYKWLNGLAVEDLAREGIVIERATADALRFGLTPDTSERFFQAQITAAKEIQSYWFNVWSADRPAVHVPTQAPDLNAEIRPWLLDLGETIIRTAAAAIDDSAESSFSSISVEGLSERRIQDIYQAARDLEAFRNRLQQVLTTGSVRIATTGDYVPFSFKGSDGSLTGIDIDLGRDLAAALGVAPVFVETSWPTLMTDLIAGRYDIAMSGVSRTLARQRHGYLSTPYHVGGKTPIARCDRAEEFASLAAIDRRGVTVVVNPGGTNERFVDANIGQARKLVFPDNRRIFEEIVDKRADVMVTDRIEVTVQTVNHPELCATMDANLTYQEKAYLIPQDVALLEFVNTWLQLRKSDGTVASTFAAHGAQ